MKIAVLTARYPPDFIGGGELSTAAIAEGLAARGHTVQVFTGAPKDQDETLNSVAVHRRQSLHELWGKPLLEKRSSRRVRRVFEAILPGDADILHAHEFRSALALSLLDHPHRVVTVRDFASICGTTNNMWWDGRSCDGCFWPNVLFRCHRVVEASPARKPFRVWQYKYNLGFRGQAFGRIPHHLYISASLRDRIATRMPLPPSTAVIQNPVSEAWLQPPLPTPESLHVVYAGTVESYKGIDTLLQAWRELTDVPGAHLDIIGTGVVEHYTAKARALGIAASVSFLGKLPPERVREHVDRARVVVQPSLWEEPFGRTVIEAYARGRAVVASDIGGLKDLVSDDTGIRVPSGDAHALAQALRHFLADATAAAACGRAGRARVEREFTAHAVSEQYETFYKKRVLQLPGPEI